MELNRLYLFFSLSIVLFAGLCASSSFTSDPCLFMGKQLKRSNPKSAAKKLRQKLVLGSIGNASVEDKSQIPQDLASNLLIASLNDADFDFSYQFSSSDEVNDQ